MRSPIDLCTSAMPPRLSANHGEWAFDAKGRRVARWVRAVTAPVGAESMAHNDFGALTALQLLQETAGAAPLHVLPVAWSTLRDAGAHYLHRLDHVNAGKGVLAVEVDPPDSPAEVCRLLAYRREFAERKVLWGLRLPATPHLGEMLCAQSVARATHAAFVVLTPAAARGWDQTAVAPTNSWGGAILVMADVRENDDLRLADRIGALWRTGPAAVFSGRAKKMDAASAEPGEAMRPCQPPRPFSGACLAVAVAAMTTVACGSAPQPAVPDGSSRVPVNDPNRLASFTQASQAQTQAVAERSALYDQVGRLQRQVQDLRNVVTVMLAEQAQSASEPKEVKDAKAARDMTKPTAPNPAAPSVLSPTWGSGADLPAQSVSPVPGGLAFRLFQAFGRAQFEPTTVAAAMDAALRQAARDATAVEVCGYTDSAWADEPNRRVAWARANEARRWLIAQGVDPQRIRLRFEPAGHFLADNNTEAGRAQNRRVELVFKGDMAQAAALVARRQG